MEATPCACLAGASASSCDLPLDERRDPLAQPVERVRVDVDLVHAVRGALVSPRSQLLGKIVRVEMQPEARLDEVVVDRADAGAPNLSGERERVRSDVAGVSDCNRCPLFSV